jgi:hypothetical protein
MKTTDVFQAQRSSPWLVAITFSMASIVGTGCSGNNPPAGNNAVDSGDSDSTDGDLVSCDSDPRVDHSDGGTLRKVGALGQISADLVMADPSPPAVTTNTWTVALRDASGAPFVNATVVVTAKMPDHSHPPSVPPMVSPAGDGTYSIAPLYFFMPGVWQIRLDIYGPGGTDAGAALDAVIFTSCVE